MKGVIYALVTTYIVFAASSVVAESSDPVSILFDSCYELDQGEPSAPVMNCYKKVLALDASHEWANNNLGYLLAVQGDSAAALKHIDAALQTNPRNALAHENRGDILYDDLKLDEAYASYSEAYKLDPSKRLRSLFRVAEIHQDRGENQEAIRRYTDYLLKDPKDTGALSNRGLVYHLEDEPELALSDFNEVLGLDATFWPARLNRALVYQKQKRYKKALSDINKILSDDASTAAAKVQGFRQRAMIKHAIGETEEALTDVNKGLQIDPDNSILLGLKKNYLAPISPAEAQEIAERLEQMKQSDSFEKKKWEERNVMDDEV